MKLANNKNNYKILKDLNNPVVGSLDKMKIAQKFSKLNSFKELMQLIYFEGPSSFYQYYNSQKRIYSAVFIPKELMYVFNADVISFESLSSLVAVSDMRREIILNARSIIPSSTYCSYSQAVLGVFDGGFFPLPHVFIAPTILCEEAMTHMRYLSETYEIPIYYIDCPNDNSRDSLKYLADQFKELMYKLSDFFNIKINENNLSEIIKISNESRDWWIKTIESFKHINNNTTHLILKLLPMGFQIISKFGLKENLEIIKNLYSDMQKIIKNSKNEKIQSKRVPRILLSNLLPYHSSAINKLLQNLDVNIVSSDLCLIHWEELDTNDPWIGMAKRFMHHYLLEYRVELLNQAVKEWDIDGIIEFCNPGCRLLSGYSYLVKDFLNRMSVPYVAIECDFIDKENFSLEQIKTRIEAFIEILQN